MKMQINDFKNDILIKYDSEKIVLDKSRTYIQESLPDLKPVGFWLTNNAEDNWKDFCIAESFWLEKLQVENLYKFSKSANILIIENNNNFNIFDDKYSVKMDEMFSRKFIDWQRVSMDYDGIYFPKYFWNYRMTHFWYYGWDCTSACIWNLDAIDEN